MSSWPQNMEWHEPKTLWHAQEHIRNQNACRACLVTRCHSFRPTSLWQGPPSETWMHGKQKTVKMWPWCVIVVAFHWLSWWFWHIQSAWFGENNALTVTLNHRKHVHDELRKDIQFIMTMEMIWKHAIVQTLQEKLMTHAHTQGLTV